MNTKDSQGFDEEDLLKHADNGLFKKGVSAQAVKLFYARELQHGSNVTLALMNTADQFDVHENTIRNIIFNRK